MAFQQPPSLLRDKYISSNVLEKSKIYSYFAFQDWYFSVSSFQHLSQNMAWNHILEFCVWRRDVDTSFTLKQMQLNYQRGDTPKTF